MVPFPDPSSYVAQQNDEWPFPWKRKKTFTENFFEQKGRLSFLHFFFGGGARKVRLCRFSGTEKEFPPAHQNRDFPRSLYSI